MGEAAYFGFDSVLHTPLPYLPHQKKTTPPPFHCLPVNPGYFGRTSWLSWFSRKKGRGRTGQEATLKQPRELNFQFWNQIFGQVTRQWAWATGTTQTTAPTWNVDLNFSKWGPHFEWNGDQMGTFGNRNGDQVTKWGLNGDLKSVYLINWPKRANSLK